MSRSGYLGGFSVDGVLPADGFLPTELNPRFSGGLSAIAKGLPDFPLRLMLDALASGYDLGLTAAQFEAMLVESADAHRWGGGGLSIPSLHPTGTDEREIIVSGNDLRLARAEEQSHGVLMLGPSAVGAYLRFEPHTDRVLPGRSIADGGLGIRARRPDLGHGHRAARAGTRHPHPDSRSRP